LEKHRVVIDIDIAQFHRVTHTFIGKKVHLRHEQFDTSRIVVESKVIVQNGPFGILSGKGLGKGKATRFIGNDLPTIVVGLVVVALRIRWTGKPNFNGHVGYAMYSIVVATACRCIGHDATSHVQAKQWIIQFGSWSQMRRPGGIGLIKGTESIRRSRFRGVALIHIGRGRRPFGCCFRHPNVVHCGCNGRCRCDDDERHVVETIPSHGVFNPTRSRKCKLPQQAVMVQSLGKPLTDPFVVGYGASLCTPIHSFRFVVFVLSRAKQTGRCECDEGSSFAMQLEGKSYPLQFAGEPTFIQQRRASARVKLPSFSSSVASYSSTSTTTMEWA
jgi:hypothetical protein